MKKRIMIWSWLLIFSGSLWAGTRLTSAFDFLTIEYSPRVVATANAWLTMRGDVNSVLLNPATGASVEKQQFSFNYSNYLLDINGGSLGYSYPTERWGTLFAGVQYLDYGSFDEVNQWAEPTGNTFSASDLAFYAGISDTLDDRFSYGVTVKYIYSRIESYAAQAVALDFGLLYRVPFEKDLYVGVVLANLGKNFDYYAGTEEQLPLRLNVAISKKLAHLPLELSLSWNSINMEAENWGERLRRFAIGGEFRVSETLRLRLGYNHEIRQGFEEEGNNRWAGVNGGLGIYWRNYRIDYSYSNYSALGNYHRFGIWGTLGK